MLANNLKLKCFSPVAQISVTDVTSINWDEVICFSWDSISSSRIGRSNSNASGGRNYGAGAMRGIMRITQRKRVDGNSLERLAQAARIHAVAISFTTVSLA